MKHKELTSLKAADLDKKEAEVHNELIKLRGQVATGTPPKNPGQIKQYKKTLARIATIRTQQQKEESQKHA